MSNSRNRLPLADPAKAVLKRTGLWPVLHEARYRLQAAVNPTFRRQARDCRANFLDFRQRYHRALQHELMPADTSRQPALIVGIGFLDGIKLELGLIKGLELAGLCPVVLTRRDPWLLKTYRLTGHHPVLCWDEFLLPAPRAAAEAIVHQLRSFEDLLAVEMDGVRVGRFAASTTLRQLRVGSLDVRSPQVREELIERLSAAMQYAAASQAIVREVRPRLALFVDKGYTPHGELFDACLARGIEALTWNAAHRSNALILKRYRHENRDDHPASLSEDTWHALRKMGWTQMHRQRVYQEIRTAYTTGDWYSEVGTQFHTRMLEPEQIQAQLGLDSSKKTALIFPHIFWDGTFFWGTDLFRNYEDWFLESVKAACANNQVNWVIKIHPGNVVKNARDGWRAEPSELTALRQRFGSLPPHLAVIPAESEINTFSLYGIADYCLTVRGTVGIEAASLGATVLTAGTGRYDRKGFTLDSSSPQEYLARLATLQALPPLSAKQQELAQRFAYGTFVLRPLALKTVTLAYRRDATASIDTQIRANTKEDWLTAPDLLAFAAWVTDSEALDFVGPDLNDHPPHAAVSAAPLSTLAAASAQ